MSSSTATLCDRGSRFGRQARDLPAYRLARKRSHGFTDYDRHLWRWGLESPAKFAEDLVRDRVSWHCQCAAEPPPFQLTEHADAGQYIPYVRRLGQVVAEGFGKVVADQLGAVRSAQRNLRARDETKQQIIQAVEQAWQAPEAAGRPGIGPVHPDPRFTEDVRGWRVGFDWFVWWSHQGERQDFRIAEHADPAEYLPYLQGITEVLTTRAGSMCSGAWRAQRAPRCRIGSAVTGGVTCGRVQGRVTLAATSDARRGGKDGTARAPR